MINPVTQRPWGKHDAATLKAAGFSSPEWATETQWRRIEEPVRAGELPTMVAFTRGTAKPAPGARLYPVFNRDQLDSTDEPENNLAFESIDGSPRLTSFLIRRGGIRPCGDLRAMDAHKVRPGLIRRNGMRLDRAAEAAFEAGYLPGCDVGNGVDDNQLLDAIATDLRGVPVHPGWSGCPF